MQLQLPVVSFTSLALACALACAVTCGALPAQYTGEPAAVIAAPAPFPALGGAALGGQQTVQVHLAPHASLPAGSYYCTAALFGVTTAHMTLRSGVFDSVTGAFTGSADVDAQNTAFAGLDLQSPSVSNDLQVLVFQTANVLTFTYTIYWATRSAPTGAFGAAQPVAGLPAGAFDPQLGQVNGTPVLFYGDGAGLSVADFAPATGTVSNARIVCSTGNPHAPMPIRDGAGETRLVAFGDFNTSEALLLASTTSEDLGIPPLVLYNEPADFYFGGCAIGGALILGGARGVDPVRLDLAGMASAYASASAPVVVELASVAPPRAAGTPGWIGVTLLGSLASGPLPLPVPFAGNLSLQTFVALPAGTHDAVNGFLVQKVPAPALPAGTMVFAQAAVCDLVAMTCFLGNTAKIEWR